MVHTLRRRRSGDLVQMLRARSGLTQRELAARVGKPQSMIARWERGHDSPRLDSLIALAHACGAELDLTMRARDEVDRAQIRRHLELTPSERLQNVENVAAFAAGAKRRQ
jgi:transcriptional regulator with XRE-family HTH domain